MILCQRYCAEGDIMIFEHTQYSTKSEINGMTRVKYVGAMIKQQRTRSARGRVWTGPCYRYPCFKMGRLKTMFGYNRMYFMPYL